MEFGIKNDFQVVDYVCASFVRKPTDVEYLRNVLNGKPTKIISKIQNY